LFFNQPWLRGDGLYKFLAVDDEEIVCRGFRKKIAWEEAGFEYLEPCKNGREAIVRVALEHPDVVMTDICMPLVDGLELASYIADQFPEIIVFILSGYDEFEYARAALRSRVVEYLLKPITSQELSEVVKKLKFRLDQNAKQLSALKTTKPEARFPNLDASNIKVSSSMAMAKVIEAQEYIERNYSNKDLSCEEVCRVLYISQSYLSRLLKRHLGKTFVDTLTELRMEKAKQLLEKAELKTYEVADAIGVGDPHYFSTIFKKMTGMTPSGYRAEMLKAEQV
jgi:YesN/AraC family two-component response regulator